MIVFTFITCKKEDTEDMAFGAGDWSGTDISFKVSGNPQKISNMEFTYGYTSCSIYHEISASFANTIDITDHTFTADINIYNINGTFINDSTAEIEISWSGYDSGCAANYSGTKTYNASYIP
jgi:hypothetical protein